MSAAEDFVFELRDVHRQVQGYECPTSGELSVEFSKVREALSKQDNLLLRDVRSRAELRTGARCVDTICGGLTEIQRSLIFGHRIPPQTCTVSQYLHGDVCSTLLESNVLLSTLAW